ncbi:MAG TPA: hypothetical protein PKY46_03660, partial [Ignavibacteriaceae bacterium]|nr:hypothetical protein [Ignavibacteriaceae bacterium]
KIVADASNNAGVTQLVESSRSIGIGQWVTKIVADASNNAGVTQLVESQPSKLLVAGSSPV